MKRLITSLALFACLMLPGLAVAEPLRVMAYGDSLIHGYGLPPGEAFPVQLEAALKEEGYDVTVINAGNSGETTAGGLQRLAWTLEENPDIVVLCLGANDMLRGLDPAKAEANLAGILEELKKRNIRVLLAGMRAQRGLGRDYVEAFDAIYPELAQRFGVELYPFFLEGVAARPELNQGDGIHPNAEGVALIVEQMLPHLLPLIEKERAEAGS
jgi:acyl-CoA thioesterase-1